MLFKPSEKQLKVWKGTRELGKLTYSFQTAFVFGFAFLGGKMFLNYFQGVPHFEAQTELILSVLLGAACGVIVALTHLLS